MSDKEKPYAPDFIIGGPANLEFDAHDAEIEELKQRVVGIEKNIALIERCLKTILEIFKGFRDGNGENLDDFPDRPGGEE